MTTQTSRDLDARVAAQVMGYSIYHYDKDHPDACYYMLVDDEFDPVAPFTGWNTGERKTEAEAWEDAPHFSTDPAAARLVEDEIERRGERVWREYTATLILELIDVPPGYDTTLEGWLLIRATPEQRCRAALAAVGE